MKKIGVIMVLSVLLYGCENVHWVIRAPVPIEQKQDYRQEYDYGGKDAFYYNSHLLIVNASQYRVRFVRNGAELPMVYLPQTETELLVKNELHRDVRVRILAVAYDRHDRVVGTVEKDFVFNGTGKQQVEQWVLKDWLFR